MKFRRRKRGFRFADEMISHDTVISFLFSILSIVCTIFSVIYGIVKKGNAGDAIGAVMLISCIMAFVGVVFALIARRSNVGSSRSKRIGVWVAVVAAGLCLGIVLV